MNRSYRAAIWIMAIVGTGIATVFVFNTPAPLGFSTVAAGVVTFFHFLAESPDGPQGQANKDARLRAAIASAIVVQYLVMVGLVAYFTNGADKLPPITETMIGSFTAIVGIVVAFYFGSSAYIEGKKSDQGNDAPEVSKSGTGTQ